MDLEITFPNAESFRKKINNEPGEYVHVVHAAEESRRAAHKGCVSRQVLRVQLKREEWNSLRTKFPVKSPSGKASPLTRRELRQFAADISKSEYRRIRSEIINASTR